MKIQLFILLVYCLSFYPLSGFSQDKFKWPGNARIAVCLTYDDGIITQLENAVTALDRVGLKGTFFLQGDNITDENLMDWRQLSSNGHELGNHSCFHPCSENFDWIKPEFATENYTIHRMITELQVMNSLLFAIDGKNQRTFAYPCSEVIVGGEPYVDSLRYSKMFIASRGGDDPDNLKHMKDIDVFNVPSWAVNEQSGAELIAEVEKRLEGGTMFVFMFHGVGGEYLKVSNEAHQELIEYLAKNSDVIWTAPFIEVAKHIAAEKKRLGWED